MIGQSQWVETVVSLLLLVGPCTERLTNTLNFFFDELGIRKFFPVARQERGRRQSFVASADGQKVELVYINAAVDGAIFRLCVV